METQDRELSVLGFPLLASRSLQLCPLLLNNSLKSWNSPFASMLSSFIYFQVEIFQSVDLIKCVCVCVPFFFCKGKTICFPVRAELREGLFEGGSCSSAQRWIHAGTALCEAEGEGGCQLGPWVSKDMERFLGFVKQIRRSRRRKGKKYRPEEDYHEGYEDVYYYASEHFRSKSFA